MKKPCDNCVCYGETCKCQQYKHWFRWAWKKAALPFRRVQAERRRHE